MGELPLQYELTADELTRRIVALGPQVLDLESPWKLFKVEGFHCDDIGPTLAQAQWALAKAQSILRQQANVGTNG